MASQGRYSYIGHEKIFPEDSDCGDGDADSQYSFTRSRPRRGQLNQWLHWLAHIASTVSLIGLLYHTTTMEDTNPRKCLKMFNAYCMSLTIQATHTRLTSTAPVLDGVDTQFQEIRFKYSLWYQSPFKGPPTTKVEESWHDIMRCKYSSSYTPLCGSAYPSRWSDQRYSRRYPSHRAQFVCSAIPRVSRWRIPRHRAGHACHPLPALHLARPLY